MLDTFNNLQDSMSSSLGDLIASVGEGVADAQKALDAGSLAQTLAIYGDSTKSEEANNTMMKLREIGYQPTFYVLPETKVKMKISLSLSQSSVRNITTNKPSEVAPQRLSKTRLYATPLNASNSNKYNINYRSSVELEFMIKPVPPPEQFRLVPDLTGKTIEEAKSKLNEFGLDYIIKNLKEEDIGERKIELTTPKKGTILKISDVIELVFEK